MSVQDSANFFGVKFFGKLFVRMTLQKNFRKFYKRLADIKIFV